MNAKNINNNNNIKKDNIKKDNIKNDNYKTKKYNNKNKSKNSKTSKILYIFLIILLILGIFLVYLEINHKFKNNFTVFYYESYSSSGGDRILNISYVVSNKEIIDCDGFYTFNGLNPKNESCDVVKLKNKERPFVLSKYFFEINDSLKGFYRYGPLFYSWEIVIS